MGSDFLRKLKEAVDSGKQNDAIKAGFEEIITKADVHAANPETMKAIAQKAERLTEQAGEDNQQKLTLDEVNKLNEIAKQQEKKMLENEQKMMVDAALISVNDKIDKLNEQIVALKVKIVKFEETKGALIAETSYEEKKKLINKTITDIND
jgi:hypothetical protein